MSRLQFGAAALAVRGRLDRAAEGGYCERLLHLRGDRLSPGVRVGFAPVTLILQEPGSFNVGNLRTGHRRAWRARGRHSPKRLPRSQRSGESSLAAMQVEGVVAIARLLRPRKPWNTLNAFVDYNAERRGRLISGS